MGKGYYGGGQMTSYAYRGNNSYSNAFRSAANTLSRGGGNGGRWNINLAPKPKVAARNAKARSGSRTTTTTKTLHQHAKPEGTGGWRSSQYYTPRKLPVAYRRTIRGLAKNFYAINAAGRMTQTVGLQGVFCAPSVFTKGDVNTLSQRINTNQTNKFLLMGAKSEIVFTNQDTGNARVTIYDVLARRDLSTSSNIATPLAAWQNSYGDEGGSNANYQVVATTPFSSDLFTQFFKVCKVTHATLAQGQSHTHSVSMKSNKLVDGEYIQYEGNGFKGLSHYCMVVVHGMPYNDTTTKTQVSTGAVAIDWVSKIEYKYTWMQDVDTTFGSSNTLPASFTVSESIMDIGTGATAVDAAA